MNEGNRTSSSSIGSTAPSSGGAGSVGTHFGSPPPGSSRMAGAVGAASTANHDPSGITFHCEPSPN